MDSIGFIKLNCPYPIWVDDIQDKISQNNFGVDTLYGIPLVRRFSEELNFVKDENPTLLMLKNMNILLHAIVIWMKQNNFTDDIILWYQLEKSDGLDVRIHCYAYKSFRL